MPSAVASSSDQAELHFSEPWYVLFFILSFDKKKKIELTRNISKIFRFHRIVQNGRSIAVDLIKKHAHLGDGTFLVRPSETFVGAYSLSFLRKGEFEKPAFLGGGGVLFSF
jgi:hypothetical protein